MHCTTLHLQKRILYRGLFFILSMGLLLQSFAPLRGQEVWDETLLSWPSSIQRCRRRRYRRGHGIVWLAFLRRRRWVLLCRLV